MSNTTQNTQNDYVDGLTPAEQGIAAARAQAATDEAAELREQVAALRAELDAATIVRNQNHAEILRLNDLLTHVYDTRNQAVQRIGVLEVKNDALRNRYRAARKVAARLRRDYTYRGQFIETMLQQPAPVAAQPAATVRMDSYGAFTSSVGATCDEDQTCDLCDGTGGYTTSNCGEWEERECAACDGTGARRGTPLHQERQAKRAAAIEAARLEDIPF